MLTFVVLAAALASGTIPALAQAPAADKTVAPTAKAQNPNERICERSVEETGSRLGGSRICKTRAEWAGERKPNRKDSERAPKAVGNATGN